MNDLKNRDILAKILNAVHELNGKFGDIDIETGDYIPSENTSTATFTFRNQHETSPALAFIYDTDELDTEEVSRIYYLIISNFYSLLNNYYSIGSSTYYGMIRYIAKSSTGSVNNSGSTITSTSTLESYVTNESFIPHVSNLNFIKNLKYKWYAIWLPVEGGQLNA